MTPEAKYRLKKRLSLGILSVIIIIAGYFGFMYWYNSTHLVITNTRPGNGKLAATATDVVFWYNRPITPDTAKNFSISPKVAGKTTVSGNSLAFEPDVALDDGQTFTVTISSSTSADGKFSMGATKLTFKTGFVPTDQQPQAVLDRSLKLTDGEPPAIGFFGADELTNQGVSDDQLANAEAFLKKIFDTQKVTDYAVNINNVQAAPYDSNSDNPVQTYNFDLDMNDHLYKAILDCSPFGDARLRLFDTQGKLVEDSGTLSGSANTPSN